MKTPAAVLVELGRPLELAELEIPALKPGQVLVEVSLSGVCHTQLLEARGRRGPDAYLPHLLGHEGVGVVRELGAGVNKVRPGQTVVLSWIKGAGADVPGAVYRWGGRGVNAGGMTTFQKFSVVSENRLTSLPEGLSIELAAFLGCAVATGAGAVLKAGAARAGQAAVVFGAGGVGLCAVAGAKAAGCAPIVAVDPRVDRREAARRAGATHVVDPAAEPCVAAIRALVGRAVDLAVEASGRPEAMAQALACVRERGGNAVIVGNAPHGARLDLDPREFNMGKRLLGTWGGDSVPDEDFPRYAAMIRDGRMDLSALVAEARPLERVNEALDDLESGRVLRPLIKP